MILVFNDKAIYGLIMADSQSLFNRQPNHARSRIDRRWIKSGYQGPERRSGKDRRTKIESKSMEKNLPVLKDPESQKSIGMEKLLASNTIQLKAITRLLLEKGIIEENELLAMMKVVQTELQHQKKV
jgi:hypothetical protein